MVEGVHARDIDLDQYLAATWDGVGTIEELLHLRPAVPAETPCVTHLSPPLMLVGPVIPGVLSSSPLTLM